MSKEFKDGNRFVFWSTVVLFIVGMVFISIWTVNYKPPQLTEATVVTPDTQVETKSGQSPLIGKHVYMRDGSAIKYPAGTEGVIVAVPGSDDWCGEQGGTSVRWIDFPSKNPACHWISELTMENSSHE